MRESINAVIAAIDKLSDFFGALAAGCLIVLIASMTFEVIARYAFRSPTIWAFDVSTMAYGLLYIAAAALALRKKQHIMIDFLYVRLPPVAQHLSHLLLYLFVVLPAMVLLTAAGFQEVVQTYVKAETTKITPLALHIWPFYAALSASILVLLLQVVVEILTHALDLIRLLSRSQPAPSIKTEPHL